MDYFEKLLALLQTEQDEDRQAYLKQTETSSNAERRAAGLTWYPVAIRGSEIGRGDYLTVEVERPSHQDVAHQFRFGASAALFSNHDPKADRINGTVAYQGGDRLKLTLNTDELPDWTRHGKLGIDLLFDDNSYDEMRKALKAAAKLIDDQKQGALARVLTGKQSPVFTSEIKHYPINNLNASQQEAVNKIIDAQQLAIVHGPPGTGKTTTLVQAIKALIKQNGQQILVTAPSNTAVDLLSEKLSLEGLNVLRIGNPARVSERLMALTLDSKISAHADMKEIKKLKKQASEYKNMAHKYKRNFGKAERDQRKALFDAAHQLIKEVDKTEQFITDDLLNKAQVVTATLVGANHYTIRDRKFHTVIIDEAGQSLESACWIPVLKAEKLILAGDHLQLPPTIKSQQAAKDGLSITLLEKCAALYPEAVVLLDEQYRMNEAIMGFSSKEFYESRLKANQLVANRLLFPGDIPVSFIDTAGSGFDEKQEGTSTANPEEAAFLFRHLRKLTGELKDHYTSEDFPTIAVISPYKEQIRIMNQLLIDSPELLPYAGKISVNTIDSFQGQERDVVYISLTRSNADGEIGFLSDIRRMNVAMTRARKKLVVIGDSSTLAYSSFYADMIGYTEQLNGYQSVWDYAGDD
ncbi:putative DNA helicase [Mucilaginibacter oryzae]|uniref:Putative DNA helicase n=1 Tax=Mucilaginibacter oryzae TaxID=468058 RepID=A0A316HAZ5_9SPHI|nr:AAA domain-containing protein [Mucilaginibacter oryzae]PWK77453.1 putative DNA helicase [Mucilaginibacter oryzae]